MRLIESAVVGLALALVVAGAVLGGLVAPPFTRMMTEQLRIATDNESLIGISAARSVDLAESVRRYVTDRSAPPLPAQVDGVPAFDTAAVAHLDDVRDVLLAARLATGVLAAGLAVWLGVSVARRRWSAIARGLSSGALVCVAVPVLAAAAAMLDFDAFFAAFHALFFEPGTWIFPQNALLIALFPERFWMAAGASWGAAIALAGAGLALGARSVRRLARREEAAPGHARA